MSDVENDFRVFLNTTSHSPFLLIHGNKFGTFLSIQFVISKSLSFIIRIHSFTSIYNAVFTSKYVDFASIEVINRYVECPIDRNCLSVVCNLH